MKITRPLFHEGIHWRRLTAQERDGKPWKYVLMRDVTFHFADGIPGVKDHETLRFVDGEGTTRAVLRRYSFTVLALYAWNGASCAPDMLALLQTLPHDVFFQFSACFGFPPEITLSWVNAMFFALGTSWTRWLYRIGLGAGSWAFWKPETEGASVQKETS